MGCNRKNHSFSELLKDSSIHGVKYLAKSDRPIWERVCWAIILLASLGSSFYFIYDMMISQYLNSPVVITFHPMQTSIMDIPFPAITVCSSNRIRKSTFAKTRRVVSEGVEGGHLQQDVDDNLMVLRQMDHLCELGPSFTSWLKYSLNDTRVNICERNGTSAVPGCQNQTSKIGSGFTFSPNVLRQFFSSFPRCSEMIPYCVWAGEVQNCTLLFREVVTDLGFCCVFNMQPRLVMLRDAAMSPNELFLPLSDEEREFWSGFSFDEILLNKATAATNHKNKYIRYQSKAGTGGGLSFMLLPEVDEYFCANHDAFGFRIYPHALIEYPHPGDLGVAVGPGIETFLSLQVDMTVADKSMRNLNVEQRKCYYSKEHPLESLHIYTASNCLDECLAKQVGKICGCIRLDMPLKFKDANFSQLPYCEGRNFDCVDNVHNDVNLRRNGDQCKHCLPSCNRVEYLANTAALPIRDDFVMPTTNGRNIDTNVTIVHVFYEKDSVYSRVRKQLYGFNDLYAHVGGIMGLFLGISMLSLAEPINYLFRLFANRKSSAISGYPN